MFNPYFHLLVLIGKYFASCWLERCHFALGKFYCSFDAIVHAFNTRFLSSCLDGMVSLGSCRYSITQCLAVCWALLQLTALSVCRFLWLSDLLYSQSAKQCACLLCLESSLRKSCSSMFSFKCRVVQWMMSANDISHFSDVEFSICMASKSPFKSFCELCVRRSDILLTLMRGITCFF